LVLFVAWAGEEEFEDLVTLFASTANSYRPSVGVPYAPPLADL